MKKNKKFKNKIEISMTAPEVLELLNFLSYVRDDKESWCPAAGKLNHQLYELVISRIEGRDPKPFIKTTEDVVMEIDQKKLQKLAFTPSAVDKATYMTKMFNAATPEEIIQPDPKIHNIPNDAEDPNVHAIGNFRSPTEEDWQADAEGKMHLKPVFQRGSN